MEQYKEVEQFVNGIDYLIRDANQIQQSLMYNKSLLKHHKAGVQIQFETQVDVKVFKISEYDVEDIEANRRLFDEIEKFIDENKHKWDDWTVRRKQYLVEGDDEYEEGEGNFQPVVHYYDEYDEQHTYGEEWIISASPKMGQEELDIKGRELEETIKELEARLAGVYEQIKTKFPKVTEGIK